MLKDLQMKLELPINRDFPWFDKWKAISVTFISICHSFLRFCIWQPQVYHRPKGWFGLPVSSKQQWVIRSAPDGEVIQPRTSIRHSPESDPSHLLAIFEEHLENVGITMGELMLNFIRKSVRIRVPPRITARSSLRDIGRSRARRWNGFDVQFGEHDV